MAYKHLTFNDRLKIEALQKVSTSPRVMAEKLGVHISTIYRELKRGQYEHLNSDYTTEQRYSPDIAEEKNQANLRAKGAPFKIGSDSVPLYRAGRFPHYHKRQFTRKKI